MSVEPVAYRCPCGFEGPVAEYGRSKTDQWRQDEMGCCYDDPECSHPAIVCPKCGKWFDLIYETCSVRLLTHILPDGTRLEAESA